MEMALWTLEDRNHLPVEISTLIFRLPPSGFVKEVDSDLPIDTCHSHFIAKQETIDPSRSTLCLLPLDSSTSIFRLHPSGFVRTDSNNIVLDTCY